MAPSTADQTPQQQSQLKLPVHVVGRIDIGRLIRESEGIDEFLSQASIRQPGTPMKLPKYSRLMEEVVELNKLNLLQQEHRKGLLNFLNTVHDRAPTMHMSFSADPSPAFLNSLMQYLRGNIHPLVLLHVGLQPSIGAGCVLRTNNKYFDFSLRQHLSAKRKDLIRAIQKATSDQPKPVELPQQTDTGQPVQATPGQATDSADTDTQQVSQDNAPANTAPTANSKVDNADTVAAPQPAASEKQEEA